MLNGGRIVQVLRGAVALALSRATTLAIPLVTIPATLHYLGDERFGMWMAATSLSALLALSDGGISNAVVTASARANALGDRNAVRCILSSALVLLVPAASILMLLSLASSPFIPWASVLNLRSAAAASEAPHLMNVIVIGTSLSLIAAIGTKLRRGLGHTAAAAAWETASALASIPAVLIAIDLRLGSPWLGASLLILPPALTIAGQLIYLAQHSDLAPSIRASTPAMRTQLLRSGAMFVTSTLALAVAVLLDPFLIARFGTSSDVGPYVIAQRLFTIPYLLASFWLYPQWPALTDAHAKGQHAWVTRVFGSSLVVSVAGAAILSGLIAAFYSDITRLWLGNTPTIDGLTICAMLAFSVLMVITTSCSTLMYALDARLEQVTLNLSLVAVDVTPANSSI